MLTVLKGSQFYFNLFERKKDQCLAPVVDGNK